MRRDAAGRWIVGALLVGSCVLGVLLLADGNRASVATSPDDRDRRATTHSTAADPAPSRPALRHAGTPMEPGPLGVGGFVDVCVCAAEDGTILKGVAVEIPGIDDERARRVTDASGVAVFGPLVATNFMFSAHADGRLPGTGRASVPEGGRAEVRIALAPAATLVVHVEDAAGAPLPDASVTGEALGGDAETPGRTDAHGIARLVLPVNAVVRVRAEGSGLGDTTEVARTAARAGGATELTIRLSAVGCLEGVVRDAAGAPMARASVVVGVPFTHWVRGSGLRGSVSFRNGTYTFRTGGEGRYRVEGMVAARRYRVYAELNRGWPDWTAAPAFIEIPRGATKATHDFIVNAPNVLEVHVVNDDGTAAEGATVDAQSCLGAKQMLYGATLWFAPTDDEVEVTAVAADGRRAAARARVPRGTTAEVTLRLVAPVLATASGTVVDDAGRPLAGAWVWIGRNSPDIESGSDGSWRVDAPPGSSLTVRLGTPFHEAAEVQGVAVPSQGTRVVLQRLAIVRFRLAAPPGADRAPSPQIEIGRSNVSRPRDASGVYEIRYTPGAGQELAIQFGPARFGRLPPKPTTEDLVTAYAAYAPVVIQLRSEPGQVEDLGTIALERPSLLRGRVVDADGRPVPGATVRTAYDEPSELSVTADAAGVFSFHAAPSSGAAPVVVEAAGFVARRVNVPAGPGVPDVVLLRGALVWGRVTDPDGFAASDAEVSATDAAGVTTKLRADSAGVFGARLAAGRWTLVAQGGPAESVQASEGGESEVRLIAGER